MAMVSIMVVLLGVLAISLLGIAAGKTGGHSGVMANTGDAMQMSSTRMASVAAFNMAESGVEYTLQWLNSLPDPPSYVTAFAPAFTWSSKSMLSSGRAVVTPDPSVPGSTFSIMVYPDVSNSGSTQKMYLIESIGTSGGMKQAVQAYVQVTSLSKWLVLVNQWQSNNYWVADGSTTFDGPVHDNNAGGVNENVLWFTSTNTPIFTYTGSDAYDISGSNVNWYKDWNLGGTQAPTTADDWAHVAAGGANTVSTGTPTVPFPSSSVAQQYAALGQTPPASGVTTPPSGAPQASDPVGVTVTPSGGTYIHGDTSQMTLSVDGGGNQIVVIQQTDANGQPYTTTLTIDKNNGNTKEHVDYFQQAGKSGNYKAKSSDTNVNGPNNGVIYSDGNIGTTDPDPNLNGTAATGGVTGVVADNTVDGQGNITHRNALTIATDHSKNLNIDGNLTYSTARQKDASGHYIAESADPNFVKHAGTLGIVSNNVLLTVNDSTGAAMNTVEVDASVLAYGVYDVDHYWTRPVGSWENMGGYLSNNIGIMGVFGGSGLTSGMANYFNYDARMRDTPPPFFPTSGSSYDVLSWKRVSATLDGTYP